MYRLQIKERGTWHTGIIRYTTKAEALERRASLVKLGFNDHNIRVVAETVLFN